MSGQQIGMVVGGAVGFFAGGNVALGMSIGGAIGGALDPPHYKAPGIGDPRPQTSQAGMPIPKFFGKPKPQPCTVIDGDPVARKIYIETEQGKGGGPTVTSEGWIATRAFLVGEADEPLAGIGRIRRNGKLVYSTIAGDDLDADSAAFRSQLRIYLGGHTQLPDPSLEAIHGVGNTPYHRGKCYFVVVDDDETSMGGGWNHYEVEPIVSGTASTTVPGYSANSYPGNNPWNPNAPSLRDPRTSLISYQYAYIDSSKSYNDSGITWRATPDEALADAATATGRSLIGTPELMGWCMDFNDPAGTGVLMAPWEDITTDPVDWSDRYVLSLLYARYPGEAEAAIVTEPDACGNFPDPIWGAKIKTSGGTTLHANATIQNTAGAPADYDNQDYCDDGSGPLVQEYNIYTGFNIACRPVATCGANDVPTGAIELPDASGFYAGLDGVVYGGDTCAVVSGTFKQLSLLVTDYEDPPSFSGAAITHKPLGPVLDSGDANYSSQVYWDAAYAVAEAAGDAPPGMTYSANGLGGIGTYPRAATTACQCTRATPLIDPSAAILKDIITDVVGRTPCPVAKLNIDNLLDEVPGYAIDSADISAADVIRDLLGIHFADMVEYDGKINGSYRGGTPVVEIVDSDILALDDEDDDTREMALEYNPLRVTVIYPDPANNYVDTPATSPRDTPDVVATGELVVQTSIPYDATTARRKAEILQKVVYARAEGGRKRALRAEHARLVASDAILIEGRREMIIRRNEDLGMVRIETTYDRASAYASVTTGVAAPTPTGQVSNLKGPTIFAAWNGPQLRDQDDVPGLHLAACGLLPGWPGCLVQVSFDGGQSWPTSVHITKASVMGELSANIGASGEPVPVSVYGAGSLASVAADQLPAGANAFAILPGAGIVEVGQFQTATLVDVRQYELTDVTRGGLETDAATHLKGERFVLLSAVYFLPIDLKFAGQTVLLRPVTDGTSAAAATTYPVLFEAPEYVEDGGGA